jgi:hypothetical protein
VPLWTKYMDQRASNENNDVVAVSRKGGNVRGRNELVSARIKSVLVQNSERSKKSRDFRATGIPSCARSQFFPRHRHVRGFYLTIPSGTHSSHV